MDQRPKKLPDQVRGSLRPGKYYPCKIPTKPTKTAKNPAKTSPKPLSRIGKLLVAMVGNLGCLARDRTDAKRTRGSRRSAVFGRLARLWYKPAAMPDIFHPPRTYAVTHRA